MWISAVSATFLWIFPAVSLWFGELFCGFQRFQLLFSRIFPAFGLDWGAVLEVLWITATQGLQGIEQGIVQGRREERISTLVTFFKNDGTVAAAKQMLNSSDDDIKTAKEHLAMIEE